MKFGRAGRRYQSVCGGRVVQVPQLCVMMNFCTLHFAHIEQRPAEILQDEVGSSHGSELSERYPRRKRGDA
jgi:hypothetical protein